jgi:hypothetical protein
MKCLSLRHPWCHLVLFYGKSIENRKWNTAFRGEFLIHASTTMTHADYRDAEVCAIEALSWTDADCAAFKRDFEARARFGGIVGRARLVDVVQPWVADLPRGADRVSRLYPPTVNLKWHARDQYGFILTDVAALPFVPLRGRLNFFEVPADLVPEAS